MEERGPLALGVAARSLGRCTGRAFVLLARRRIHQPALHLGRQVAFADGSTAVVYRETVVVRGPTAAPAVLVVGFRLRWARRGWQHAVFRWESVLNTVLFVGFAGFVSKLWLAHDEHGVYRGVYQWDGAARAEAYVGALWWVLSLVSVPGSIHHAVLPGLHRDALLQDPGLADGFAAEHPGAWWRPVPAAAQR